jgi:hypothetical protein
MNQHRRPRYLFAAVFLLLGAVTKTHSLGFTNIFGVIHHKTDEEAKHMNDLLEEEDSHGEHFAWFPQGSMVRSVQDVSFESNRIVRKKRRIARKKTSTPLHPMNDVEFLEHLILLQD